MRKNMMETILGAVVLAAALVFMTFAYSAADLGGSGGYEISASFDRVDGVVPGTDVKIGGIKVGKVIDQFLDVDRYLAIVRMDIDSHIRIPVDSAAQVASEGLLGGTYIALVPGNEEDYLEPGDRITYTQGPVDLVQLLGKFIFSGDEKKGE